MNDEWNRLRAIVELTGKVVQLTTHIDTLRYIVADGNEMNGWDYR